MASRVGMEPLASGKLTIFGIFFGIYHIWYMGNIGIFQAYLQNIQKAIENGPVEIVSFPS
jgi:hypothetical protein